MAHSDKSLARPLSPFWVYRWQYTNTLSILHRLTGVALTAGAILLVYWLTAAAFGSETYAHALEFFASPVVKVLLIGWAFCFWYHFCNGIRHLVWDTGRGFELKVARLSGYAVFLSAVLLTVLTIVLFARAGGAA